MTLMETLMEEDPNSHEEDVSGFPISSFHVFMRNRDATYWKNIIYYCSLCFPLEIVYLPL